MSTESSSTTTATADQLLEAMRALVAEESRRACQELLAEMKPVAASGDGAPAPTLDMEKLADEVSNSAPVRERVNQSLEAGLRNVLPQILQRLKQEIEERIGENAGGGGSCDIHALVNSTELKEMLEGQFRQMLQYLTQDVIPKELQKLTGRG